MSTPISPATSHPAWCDPRICSTTGADVRHSSEPLALHPVLDDVEVTVAVVRDDEHTRDGRHLPGPGGITLDVRHTSGSTWPDGGPIRADVLLTPAEAIELASRLLGCAALADRAGAS
ncbi:hypothetical protein [Pseudonocardia zijingensis]|uniref:Uncharacterized protein n=1 Tax=Pseudonocardia zijingensis TaxID=153376 RepID=A0ABP4ADL2_9PSEU